MLDSVERGKTGGESWGWGGGPGPAHTKFMLECVFIIENTPKSAFPKMLRYQGSTGKITVVQSRSRGSSTSTVKVGLQYVNAAFALQPMLEWQIPQVPPEIFSVRQCC